MKWLIGALLALAVIFPARADSGERWFFSRPNALETTLHVAAMTMVVLDVSTTLDIKNHRASRLSAPVGQVVVDDGVYETNPLLGAHPSDLRLVAYGVGVIALHTALWYFAPRDVRLVLDALTIGVEIPYVAKNLSSGLRLRLPF